MTSFGDDRPDDTRTLFFTAEDVWFGDVPGLAEALAGAGAGAAYLRRPVTDGGEDAPLLVDVLVELLLNLSAARRPTTRGPSSTAATRWEGQRSIDSRLTSLFGLPGGRTVAVGAVRRPADPVRDAAAGPTTTST